jgi:hypothetical protein
MLVSERREAEQTSMRRTVMVTRPYTWLHELGTRPRAARILLEKGAGITVENNRGETALDTHLRGELLHSIEGRVK